ncbi:FAD-dependent oxidoreductase [Gracilibacillus sp. S3-1-1]|uniref:FAD-dependent oxidoreductase n=1 Tax=Gracilibacillus pellucidus TaxID=3095368 RepID=A0ACC6M5J7_9BACI|nr:FAD-dependent oxidoreductase [Gracilibacillus sp. S3-1-1]MDX8046190.1 FAD-dependent oxidoreductase [Gracilibacillus sp. S3-1-1]
MSKSIWLTDEMKSFSPIQDNLESDVVIIGGGITGILSAYLLSNEGMRVVLVERDRLFHHTTGHTTAKLTAQHALIYNELIGHFGLENAQKYYQSQVEAIQFVRELTNKLQISCQLEQQDAILYTNDDKNKQKFEQEATAYQQLNIKGEMQNSIPFEIPHKCGLSMAQQAQFHPVEFLRTIVEKLIENNVKIYEETTAVDIDYGNKTIVRTAHNLDISADHVIVATQFPFYEGQAFYSTRMYPSRSYVLGITTNQPYPGGMYLDIDQPKRSIRTVQHENETIWLVGGEAHKTGQYDKENTTPYHDLENFCSQYLHVKDWKYQWSAQDFSTLDKVPYIGSINKQHPNVYVATGYRKWGMTNSIVAAHILSDSIMQRDNPYKELFKPQRFHADPDIKKFISYNSNVTKEFVTGKLNVDENNKLEPETATKMKVDGQIVGVFKDKDHKIHAVDTTCTHLGCECNWNNAEKTWDCPCHGSRFNYDGKIIEGPATKNLKQVDI